MSVSDAAPLPRLGEVFFDVRGNSRSMRLSWYADTGVAVFSIWQAGMCTGTFRLPMADLRRMIGILERGPTPQGRGRQPVTAARQSADRDDLGFFPDEDEIGGLESSPRSAGYATRDSGPAGPVDEYGSVGYDARGYGPGSAAGDGRTAEHAAPEYRSPGRTSDYGTSEYGSTSYGTDEYGAGGARQSDGYGSATDDYRADDYGVDGGAAGYGPPADYEARGYGPGDHGVDGGAAGYGPPADYEAHAHGAGDYRTRRDADDHEPDGRDYGQSGYGRVGYGQDDSAAWQRWSERPEYDPSEYEYERRPEPGRDDLGAGYDGNRRGTAGSHRRADAGHAERGARAVSDADTSGYSEERFVPPYVHGGADPYPNDNRAGTGGYERRPADPAYPADRRADSASGRHLDSAEPQETYSYGAEYRYR